MVSFMNWLTYKTARRRLDYYVAKNLVYRYII